ncbi:MAG: NAD-dependent epimerase/dehydratase family protein [Anaerolineales bacterium]
MRVFVTGATGFLGRHLIDLLLSEGCQVTALIRTFDRARSLPAAVRPISGDVSRRDSLRAGMRGAEIVFHTAAWVGRGARPKDYARLARINVEGTRAVLELAAELGGPRVVVTSTLEVFGSTRGQLAQEDALPAAPPAETEYARSKYRALVDVVAPMQAAGLPVTVVCPGRLFGPGDHSDTGRLLHSYAQRRLLALAGPETAFCWTHAADAARGHWLAATRGRPGQTYLLPGPALSYREFFASADAVTRIPAPAVYLPSSLPRLLARALQPLQPGLAETLRRFDGSANLGRPDKANAELGWQPQPLDEALRQTVEALAQVPA